MRLLHAIARAGGEGHERIRDRAATLFDLTSLTELSSDQVLDAAGVAPPAVQGRQTSQEEADIA